MARALLPPKTEPLIDDDKFSTLNWLAFFEDVANGDLGTAWTPTFVGLTETGGTATITGTYWRLTNSVAYFRIVITPVTSTSAVNGTTYCDNFPLNITAAGLTVSLNGFSAILSGATSADKRIYTATWTGITSPVTIVGILEVS